jgi:hypothetical protein
MSRPDGTGNPVDAAVARAARYVSEASSRSGQQTWRDLLHEAVSRAFATREPLLLRAELAAVAEVAGEWAADIERRGA